MAPSRVNPRSMVGAAGLEGVARFGVSRVLLEPEGDGGVEGLTGVACWRPVPRSMASLASWSAALFL